MSSESVELFVRETPDFAGGSSLSGAAGKRLEESALKLVTKFDDEGFNLWHSNSGSRGCGRGYFRRYIESYITIWLVLPEAQASSAIALGRGRWDNDNLGWAYNNPEVTGPSWSLVAGPGNNLVGLGRRKLWLAGLAQQTRSQ